MYVPEIAYHTTCIHTAVTRPTCRLLPQHKTTLDGKQRMNTTNKDFCGVACCMHRPRVGMRSRLDSRRLDVRVKKNNIRSALSSQKKSRYGSWTLFAVGGTAVGRQSRFTPCKTTPRNLAGTYLGSRNACEACTNRYNMCVVEDVRILKHP